MARREYQRLAFSATPLPAENTLVLKTSSLGVSSVSRAKEDEEGEASGVSSARSLHGLGRGLGLGLGLGVALEGVDHKRRREAARGEGEGSGWEVRERGSAAPGALSGEL